MIIDPGKILHSSLGCERLSKYLTLCKLDVLVVERQQCRPTRSVDQPSKVGDQSIIVPRTLSVHQPEYVLQVDYNQRRCGRNFTLRLKSELLKKVDSRITNLSEAGTIAILQGNRDLEWLPLYKVSLVDNFASRQMHWSFCFTCNKQGKWVNAFLELSKKSRLQVDYLIVSYYGEIQVFNIPKLKEVCNYEVTKV